MDTINIVYNSIFGFGRVVEPIYVIISAIQYKPGRDSTRT